MFTTSIPFVFRGINDPEHPLTLEQLDVVKMEDVIVDDESNEITVVFTPTIPHCSMATLIGLSIRVKLLRSLPSRFKVHTLSVSLDQRFGKTWTMFLHLSLDCHFM